MPPRGNGRTRAPRNQAVVNGTPTPRSRNVEGTPDSAGSVGSAAIFGASIRAC